MILTRGAFGRIIVHAPAKVNLFFEVLAKRDDGFHEIQSLMSPIDLYDTLLFEEDRSGRIRLTCERADVGFGLSSARRHATREERLPNDGDNLVVQAVELLRRERQIDAGATIRLIKRIPIASGLGGGSSDAAAALLAASTAWGVNVQRRELTGWGARLGSDVPLFFADGMAACGGRGEVVEPVRGAGVCHLVIVRPPEGLSTAAVYRACRPATRPRAMTELLDALRRGDMMRVGAAMINRLQPVAAGLSPWIDRLAARFERMDLPGHMMSGSGTAYFGICRHAAHARRVARRLIESGIGSVYTVRTCRH